MRAPKGRHGRRHSRGTRELRRRFPGVPPIRVASGTHRQNTFKRLDKMLTDLFDTGRLDYLRLIAEKVITPLDLFDRIRGKEYEKLPAPIVQPLEKQVTDWQAERVMDVGPDQRKNDRWAWRRLLAHIKSKETATADCLPAVLRRERDRCQDAGQFAAFNRIRAAVLAFLRDTGFRRTNVYLDVLDIRVLPTSAKRAGMPLTPLEAIAVAAALPPGSREAWWTMCLTGMGPGEFWGAWTLEDGHIHVFGRKRPQRNRLVPQVAPPSRPLPGLTPKMLQEQVQDATDGRVQPYDARRTYARWLAEAGVIPIHQDAYLGHGPRTMTELYQRGNETPYLDGDAAKMRAWLRAELGGAQAGATLTAFLTDRAPESGPVDQSKLLAAVTDAPRGS